MKKTCLICGDKLEYKHKLPPGELEDRAENDIQLYRYLVCSNQCISKITNGKIEKIRETLPYLEIKLYDNLNYFISVNPEFTYILLDKLQYDYEMSKDKKRPTYLAEWKILRIAGDGEMTINKISNDKMEIKSANGEMVINKIANNGNEELEFVGAWYSDKELGFIGRVGLDKIMTQWNNTQYFKTQNDKDESLSELLEYCNSVLWKTRKKYFDNVLTEFREWYRINKYIPPDLESFVEPKNYSGNPKSAKVKRLLELAVEFNLQKGQSIPKDVKCEISLKLEDEGFGETSGEYVRRTLHKYHYAKTKNFENEWGDLPIRVPGEKGTEPLVEPSPSDDYLDESIA